jgi:hypothetical protein
MQKEEKLCFVYLMGLIYNCMGIKIIKVMNWLFKGSG